MILCTCLLSRVAAWMVGWASPREKIRDRHWCFVDSRCGFLGGRSLLVLLVLVVVGCCFFGGFEVAGGGMKFKQM